MRGCLTRRDLREPASKGNNEQILKGRRQVRNWTTFHNYAVTSDPAPHSVLRGRDLGGVLHQQRDSLSSADTGGSDAVASVRTLQFAGQRNCQTHACRGQRMADGDGSAVDVQLAMIQAQFARAGQSLRSEGFVDFETVDLVKP